MRSGRDTIDISREFVYSCASLQGDAMGGLCLMDKRVHTARCNRTALRAVAGSTATRTPIPRNVESSLGRQVRILRGAGVPICLNDVPTAPSVGPAGALPALTPTCVRGDDRWYADFVFAALSELCGSVRVWPALLWCPDAGTGATVRDRLHWSWLQFASNGVVSGSASGGWMLNALLASCLLHPHAVSGILDGKRFVRVPHLLIGDDGIVDFPVLFRADGEVVLHTYRRNRDLLRAMHVCTFTVHR